MSSSANKMTKYYISTLMCGNSHVGFLDKVLSKLSFPVGIEYFCFELNDSEKAAMYTLRRHYEAREAIMHAPMVNTEGTSEYGTEEYNSLIDVYRQTIRMCRDFKVNELVFHCNERIISREVADRLRCNSISNAVDLSGVCANDGIKLLVETLALPVKGFPLFTDKQYVQAVKANDLFAIIDVGHVNVNGYNLEYLTKSLGNRVREYHLHNNDGKDDSHKGIFEGTFDYEQFAYLYKKYTHDAKLVFEYGDMQRTPESVAQDVEYIKKIIT